MKHVTIIGGGIAGLSTAYYLQKYAAERNTRLTYCLLDASPQFGGKIVTARSGDFVIEGGPDSFITQKPWGLDLCRELGLEDALLPCNAQAQSVSMLRGGRLVKLPRGLRLTVPTQIFPFLLSPLVSLPGKLRMAYERFVPVRKDNRDESVGAFVRRRLGREAADIFAGPLMAGIYVSDPDRMSIDSTFPMFPRLERKYGSLLKAMQAERKARPAGSTPPPMFVSLRDGMQTLVRALEVQLHGDLRTGTRVSDLSRTSGGFKLRLSGGDELETDHLVLAVSAREAAELTRPVHPGLAEKLSHVRFVSTAAISLAYRGADVPAVARPHGFGFVVPKEEGRDMIACTCSSSKFAHRASGEDLLLRVFVGGDGKEHLADLADEDLLSLARRELSDILGLEAEPVAHRCYHWPAGNPQYDVGHLDRVQDMERLAAEVGELHLVGSSYRGIGIPDCVHSGEQAAARVIGDGVSL